MATAPVITLTMSLRDIDVLLSGLNNRDSQLCEMLRVCQGPALRNQLVEELRHSQEVATSLNAARRILAA